MCFKCYHISLIGWNKLKDCFHVKRILRIHSLPHIPALCTNLYNSWSSCLLSHSPKNKSFTINLLRIILSFAGVKKLLNKGYYGILCILCIWTLNWNDICYKFYILILGRLNEGKYFFGWEIIHSLSNSFLLSCQQQFLCSRIVSTD